MAKTLSNFDPSMFDGDLILPYDGVEYRVPEPTAKEVLRLQNMLLGDEMDNSLEIYEMRKLMGQTWHDLIEVDIGWAHLVHMGRTALISFVYGFEVGENFWKLDKVATLTNLAALVDIMSQISELEEVQ